MITLKNDAGVVKQVKKGFSWTTLFFGIFVPLLRGDLKWAAITFFAGFLMAIMSGGFLTWVPSTVLSFVYNKIYMKELIEKGYKVADPGMEQYVMNYVNS